MWLKYGRSKGRDVCVCSRVHTKKYIEGSEENIATEKEGIVSAVEQTAFDCILVA